MRIIKNNYRRCDLCEKDDLEELYSYQIQQKTKNNISLWNVRNVICRYCGFAFVSPSPSEESLEEHYADSYELSSNLIPDYSVEKRICLIKNFLRQDSHSTYFEIGSNNCKAFKIELEKIFSNLASLEINKSCDSSFKDIKKIPELSADILAAYFVLEHVPNPKNFLLSYRDILSDDGVFIIEVPNLLIYPRDPAGLDLCEHVNHFSPYTLSELANECGYEIIETSYNKCSREFGFVAVLKKSTTIFHRNKKNRNEFIIGRSCILEGLEVLKRLEHKINFSRNILKERSNVIIWGANWYCMRLLNGFKFPDDNEATIIDIDIRKKDYLPGYTIYTPEEVLDKIERADFFIINTHFYAGEIKDWIVKNTGKLVSAENSIVIDYFD